MAAAICALLAAPTRRHAVYNIAYGEATSVEDLLRLMRESLPDLRGEVVAADEANVLVEPEKRSGRWGAYDIARLTADTGWRPRPLGEAIADYLAWMRSESVGLESQELEPAKPFSDQS